MDAAPLAPDDRGLGPDRFPGPLPRVAVRAAMHLNRLLKRLADHVIPAEFVVRDKAVGASRTAMLAVFARLGIADLLARGPRTAAEIAAAAGTDPDATHRLLRGLAWEEVIALGRDGRFRATRVSRALESGQRGRARAWATYFGSPSNQRAYIALEHAVRTGHNAFERANGQGVWDWFDEHPDEREQFAQAMMGLTVLDAPVVATLYPWAEVTTVCDVGGGRGTLLSELLIRHPHLRGVLCDGAGVLASAGSLLRARGVAERVTLAPGSFFGTVPAGADAYVLKHVLHDWDDARCRQILGVVRRSMEPGQRLVVVEAILGRDQVDLAAWADVHMLVVCNEGRERSRVELEALLGQAGFAPSGFYQDATLGIVEARAA